MEKVENARKKKAIHNLVTLRKKTINILVYI